MMEFRPVFQSGLENVGWDQYAHLTAKPSRSIRSISVMGTKRLPPIFIVCKLPTVANRFAVSRLIENMVANSPRPKARFPSLVSTFTI
jgi:hypothetical protein